jgi:hypothetical protein
MTADGTVLRPDPARTRAQIESRRTVRSRQLRLRLRHIWLVPGLAIAVYANAYAGGVGIGLLPLLFFGIAPHLPVLLGVGQPHGPGQMPLRAVPLFNVTHHPIAPMVIIVLAAGGALSPLWLVGGLVWLSHLVVDLAFGEGTRTSDGWRRGWWPLP